MLKSANDVIDFSINATDGSIGRVEEFYFDAEHWTVRYIIVNTGGWFVERRVLISPLSIERIDWNSRTIETPLTRGEVRTSPRIDSELRMLRRHEAAYNDHYHFPDYWDGPKLWGAAETPRRTRNGEPIRRRQYPYDGAESHLRGTRQVIGFYIAAQDGEIGHVDDFIFNDASWTIGYLVVDTRNWWPGKKVMLSPLWITKVDWRARKVVVDLPRRQIRESPEYDDTAPIEREYEERLNDYYNKTSAGDRHGKRESSAHQQPNH